MVCNEYNVFISETHSVISNSTPHCHYNTWSLPQAQNVLLKGPKTKPNLNSIISACAKLLPSVMQINSVETGKLILVYTDHTLFENRITRLHI